MPKLKSKKISKTVSDQHMSPCKFVDICGKYIIQLQQIISIADEITLTDQGYEDVKTCFMKTTEVGLIALLLRLVFVSAYSMMYQQVTILIN